MTLKDRLIITGGAGFIGSQLANFLLKSGYLSTDVLVVDDIHKYETRRASSLLRKKKVECLDFNALPALLQKSNAEIPRVIFHMGALASTEETDKRKLDRHNVQYSQTLWNVCAEKNIPFFYASSASTYGNGDKGFSDDPERMPLFKPLNLYAQSKHEFDLMVLKQMARHKTPQHWAGFKFFNVFGPGEDHKGSQRSVVWKAKEQIEATGVVKLFKSHNPKFEDGGQSRDFIFVEDICKMLFYFFKEHPSNGIYNAGSGKARSFKDLALATAAAMKKECRIEFIPTPEALRSHYQYFTQADLTRLRADGYKEPMTELEAGVKRALELDRELT